MDISKVDLERVMEVVEDDDMIGFCLACGEEREGCEPDARGYKCYACGKSQVYGAAEILVMFG